MSNGVRFDDPEYGRELLTHLHVDERGRFFTRSEGQLVGVEAFDEPLVARMVEREGEVFTNIFPYDWRQPLKLETLEVDEWDRFHGRSANGVPFVLSRPAQAKIFNLVDDYDDESLVVGDQRFVMPPWLKPVPDVKSSEYWSRKYGTEEAGWELGRETPILPEILPQLKLPRSRILVLGSGSGHDAAYLARAGHLVTGVDFSEVAFNTSTQLYSDVKDLKFLRADVFGLPREWRHNFDVIFEHTCFCAVPPDRRKELVGIWKNLLVERGHLLGIFFARDKQVGPPWGGSEWEIRERLRSSFDFRYWTRWRRSIEKRQGYELVVWAQLKSQTLG